MMNIELLIGTPVQHVISIEQSLGDVANWPAFASERLRAVSPWFSHLGDRFVGASRGLWSGFVPVFRVCPNDTGRSTGGLVAGNERPFAFAQGDGASSRPKWRDLVFSRTREPVWIPRPDFQAPGGRSPLLRATGAWIPQGVAPYSCLLPQILPTPDCATGDRPVRPGRRRSGRAR